MRTYKRLHQSGGCYFFTVNLAKRHDNDILIKHIESLRAAFRETRNTHLFTIDAIVILPEHLHAIRQLPEGDDDYPTRWRLIKSRFSMSIHKEEPVSISRKRKRERGIWQRRYWEHVIRDQRDYQNHLDYIHYNPVKHGYVQQAKDWPYSSFHQWVRRGKYPKNWAAKPEIIDFSWE